MNPEEKVLLERTLKLSEENNKLLHKIDRKTKWAVLWGFIKIAIIVVPIVAGYLFIEPFLRPAIENFNNLMEFVKTPR